MVDECVSKMKSIFTLIRQDAAKLDSAFATRLSRTDFRAWAVSRAALSKCGKCGGMMQLRTHERRAAAYCACCALGLVLPHFKAVEPHAHTCPLCAFQVVQARPCGSALTLRARST